jgi:hypothetical protein
MKLNRVITSRIVQQFGRAKLVQLHNGRHELIGGSAADCSAAREWVSLFAHEIVFSPKRATGRPLASGHARISYF